MDIVWSILPGLQVGAALVHKMVVLGTFFTEITYATNAYPERE
jgi:hypothetical protein